MPVSYFAEPRVLRAIEGIPVPWGSFLGGATEDACRRFSTHFYCYLAHHLISHSSLAMYPTKSRLITPVPERSQVKAKECRAEHHVDLLLLLPGSQLHAPASSCAA